MLDLVQEERKSRVWQVWSFKGGMREKIVLGRRRKRKRRENTGRGNV